MLDYNVNEILLLTKMKTDALYAAAKRESLISNLKEEKMVKTNKVTSLILNGTGKALINTGNRLLKIA